MLIICSVTDSLSTPTITEPHSVECQQCQLLTDQCLRSGSMNVRTSDYSLFQRTRAAQNVALEGIQTLPGKRSTTKPRIPLRIVLFDTNVLII